MSNRGSAVELMQRIDQMIEQLRLHIDELRAETANGHESSSAAKGEGQ